MKKRKKILLILGVLLAGAAAAGVYVYREYNRVAIDTAAVQADFSLAAPQLVAEFEKDESRSNQKYLSRIIEVNGVVREVKRDDRGFYTVVLGDTASMSSVRCSMDSLHNAEAAAMAPGQPARLKGVCTGFTADELLGSDVILVRSVVHANK